MNTMREEENNVTTRFWKSPISNIEINEKQKDRKKYLLNKHWDKDWVSEMDEK